MILTHYIIARRDLTVGDLVAQVAHAAGESFYALERTRSEGVVADHDALVSQRLEQSVF
jgi:peptidyl-tRNA hydrolase